MGLRDPARLEGSLRAVSPVGELDAATFERLDKIFAPWKAAPEDYARRRSGKADLRRIPEGRRGRPGRQSKPVPTALKAKVRGAVEGSSGCEHRSRGPTMDPRLAMERP